MNDVIIFMNNNVVDGSLSDDAFVLYVAISSMAKMNMDYVTFTTRQLEYALYGGFNMPKRKKEKMKSNINELILSGAIELICEEKGDYFIKNTFQVDKGFTTITLDEVRKIMTMDTTSDKFSILRYFSFLAYTINEDKKCGWWTIVDMAEKVDIHKSTAMEYNTLLEDSKLVYIHRRDTTIKDANGNFTKVNNTYGRYTDKDMIIKGSDGYVENLGIWNGETSKSVIDGRSVSAKYNAYIKGTYKGDVEELKQLCIQYNAYYEKFAGSTLKDLSIFENGLYTVEFVREWCVGIIDNVSQYKFTDQEFVDRLTELMDGKGFKSISKSEINKVYFVIKEWVEINKKVL